MYGCLYIEMCIYEMCTCAYMIPKYPLSPPPLLYPRAQQNFHNLSSPEHLLAVLQLEQMTPKSLWSQLVGPRCVKERSPVAQWHLGMLLDALHSSKVNLLPQASVQRHYLSRQLRA